MFLKHHLNILLICFTMFFFFKMDPVKAINKNPTITDCKGGYKTDSEKAFCHTDALLLDLHTCLPTKCSHDNTHFVTWTGCKPYYGNGPPSTQKCVTYEYYDSGVYTCTNANNDFFLCPHSVTDKSYMSCHGC
ncbi:secreted protein [Melampsora americana]|nr:secreted protein [Melampsora americana]